MLRQEGVLGVLVHAAIKGDVGLCPLDTVGEVDQHLVTLSNVNSLGRICSRRWRAHQVCIGQPGQKQGLARSQAPAEQGQQRLARSLIVGYPQEKQGSLQQSQQVHNIRSPAL